MKVRLEGKLIEEKHSMSLSEGKDLRAVIELDAQSFNEVKKSWHKKWEGLTLPVSLIDQFFDEHYYLIPKPSVSQEKNIPEQFVCKHCNMDIRIRNPSGYCDHLYYPDLCPICKEAKQPPKVSPVEWVRIEYDIGPVSPSTISIISAIRQLQQELQKMRER